MIDLFADKRDLGQLEEVIQSGLVTFVEVGSALLEIRDRRLYRETHETFDAYCRERWGFNRQRAHQMIEAAQVVGQMSKILDIPPPRNDSQARELARIPDPVERARVWQEVSAECGSQVTAADIRRIVSPPAPAPRLGVVDLDSGEINPTILDVHEVAYEIADDSGRAELARLRYTNRLRDRLRPLAHVASEFDASDAAAMIDPEFFHENIERPLEVATAWAARVRAAMPNGLRVVQGGRK